MRDLLGTIRGDATAFAGGQAEDKAQPAASQATPFSNAIPTDLAFLFGDGETPWTALPSIVARPGVTPKTATIDVHGDYAVPEGGARLASNGPQYLFSSGNGANLTNDGVIWIEHETRDTRAFSGQDWGTVTNNGAIVALSGTGSASGFSLGGGALKNHGTLTAISARDDALGFGTSGLSLGTYTTVNTGTIEAWAGNLATGVELRNGGNFENSGTVRALGEAGATGFRSTSYRSELTNSGLIEAVAGNGQSVGVLLYWSGVYTLDNSGTIRAATAILATYTYDQLITINNSGTGRIEGDIIVTGAPVALTNDGLITGDVLLGDFEDTYTQLNGQIEGRLDLGAGNDTAATDAGSQEVFGGAGTDVIHTGADADILGGGSGADYLDGGTGFDRADYRLSPLGVQIDLSTGLAAGGDASGDTLVGIEGVIGSSYADVLTGDGGSNSLNGRSGDDVLTGQGGDDKLNGGAGDDTAVFSGNQADYEIISNLDGSQTVTDLRDGSPDGSDALTDIEILQFADGSIGDPASTGSPEILIFDFLFSGGASPWTALPTIIESRPDVGAFSDAIDVGADYTLVDGEALVASNGPSTLLSSYDLPNLTNGGLIWIENEFRSSTVVRGGYWGNIANTGEIVALSKGGQAVAFNLGGTGSLQNYGTVLAISAPDDAFGFLSYAAVNHLNSGTIEAWAGKEAGGVSLFNGGGFENSGTVRATGQTGATAFYTSSHGGHLVNSGLIEAVAGNDETIGVHLNWAGSFLLENSGTIRAATAIFADYAYDDRITIINAASGRIEGDVIVIDAPVTLTNHGVIAGDVVLGKFDDVYTQLTGQLEGLLDLGEGNDTATTDAGSQNVFGGGGNDVIHTGADADRLGGGLGADMLDGGAGFDRADYHLSSLGVQVDLSTGFAAGGDASGDTLVGIEGVIGSSYADVLTGDDQDNSLNGRAGNDVLTGQGGDDKLNGGSGDDTAVFSGNQADYEIISNANGSQTVTDLRDGSPDGSDTLVDIEILQFADSSIGGPVATTPGEISILDFLFGGETPPWAPLPTAIQSRPDGGLVDETFNPGQDYTLLDGEAIIASNGTATLFVSSEMVDLTNNGLIWIEHENFSATAIASGNWDLVTNNGDIVAISKHETANGFYSGSWGVLHNHGSLIAISAEYYATGYLSYSSSSWSERETHLNTGMIEAWAGEVATGARTANGGRFENSGTIRATGGLGATALSVGRDGPLINSGLLEALSGADAVGFDGANGGSLENSGTIRATGQTTAMAVEISGAGRQLNSGLIEAVSAADNALGVVMSGRDQKLVNSGTIHADIAIRGDASYPTTMAITNTGNGVIEGDIVFNGSEDRIVNHGQITGNVFLGDRDDQFIQTDGVLTGTVDLGDGNDLARMGDGSDTVFGGLGDDRIYAGAGDDILRGDGGADRLDGGDGEDTASYETSALGVSIDLQTGSALGGDADGDILVGIENLLGSGQADSLTGDRSSNTLNGNGGHDTLSGRAGDDVLDGGAGDDQLGGGSGNDELRGGDGADTLSGGLGQDRLEGGAGNDLLFGNDGRDTLFGGDGDDRLRGGDQPDILYGDGGNDNLSGQDGSDQLFGGLGIDRLDGGAGKDLLSGGAGDDIIDGGADTDTAVFSGNYADYTVTISGSTATIVGADGVDTLTNIELLQFDDQLVNLTLDPASEPASLTGGMDLPDGFGKTDTAPLPGLAWSDHTLTPPDGASVAAFVRLTDSGIAPGNSAANAAPVPIITLPLDTFNAPLHLDHIEAGATGIDPVEGWH